jgi:uncharacterized protein with PQ loop repeat
MVTEALAAMATALAAVFLIPQIVRLIGRRDATGVSSVWAAFGVVTNSAWVGYLAAVGLWAAVPAPALATLTYGVALCVIAPLDRRLTWVSTSAGYAAVLAAAGALGGVGVLGVVLSVTPAVQLTPQVIAVFRERCPTGVSPTTWSLSIAEAVLWGCYGLLVWDLALIGYGMVTSVGSALILGRRMAALSRWRSAADVPVPGEAHSSHADVVVRQFDRQQTPGAGELVELPVGT